MPVWLLAILHTFLNAPKVGQLLKMKLFLIGSCYDYITRIHKNLIWLKSIKPSPLLVSEFAKFCNQIHFSMLKFLNFRPVNCAAIRQRNFFSKEPASEEEASFPIAFAKNVYKVFTLWFNRPRIRTQLIRLESMH